MFGNANEQAFLQALAAAPKKATFICDNIGAQAAKSISVDLDRNGNFQFSLTSSSWPINETIAICGTITVVQTYQKLGETVSVPLNFKFGAWGSAMGYADVTTQVPSLQLAYVDFCPQYANNCDQVQSHPEPAINLPDHSATVRGKVGIHDCHSSGVVKDADVEVVLNSTEEGREFNRNTPQNSVCDEIPHSFGDPNTAFTAKDALDEHDRYSLPITFKGSSVSGVLYICASVTRRRGADADNCDAYPSDGHVYTKRPVTIFPDGDLEEDLHYDYTQ